MEKSRGLKRDNDMLPVMASRSIPLAAMERIIMSAGAERVSEDAKDELKDICTKLAQEYGQRAIRYAEHAGRKTIKDEDIKLAIRQSN
jgi:DNA-binding protein